jgi:hypothetical protein
VNFSKEESINISRDLITVEKMAIKIDRINSKGSNSWMLRWGKVPFRYAASGESRN